MKNKTEIRTNFTPQHFSDYLDNKLTLNERHLFEQKLKTDPFFKDAYEGFKSNPQSLSTLSRLASKNKKFSTSYLAFGIVGFGILLVVSVLLFFRVQEENSVTEPVFVNDIKHEKSKEFKQHDDLTNVEANTRVDNKTKVTSKVAYAKIVEEEQLKKRGQ